MRILSGMLLCLFRMFYLLASTDAKYSTGMYFPCNNGLFSPAVLLAAADLYLLHPPVVVVLSLSRPKVVITALESAPILLGISVG